MLQDLLLRFVRISVGHHQGDSWVVVLQPAAIRVDVTAHDFFGVAEILAPMFQRTAVLNPDFQNTNRPFPKRRKQTIIFDKVERPLVRYLAVMFPIELLYRFHSFAFGETRGHRTHARCHRIIVEPGAGTPDSRGRWSAQVTLFKAVPLVLRPFATGEDPLGSCLSVAGHLSVAGAGRPSPRSAFRHSGRFAGFQ